MERRLRGAFAPSNGRSLRRKPEPASALLPVSGHHETFAAGYSGPVYRFAQGFRYQPQAHDIRFVEDDWESPTLGAWGVGWEVWLDGMEITQFTYFQQAGGIDLKPVSVEITYGIERICMYLQGVESVYDLKWTGDITYGDIHHRSEVEGSIYNFDRADSEMLFKLFDMYEAESEALFEERRTSRAAGV